MTQTKNLKNPTTNKTYTYKGFVPLSRLSYNACSIAEHSLCLSSPQQLADVFGFDFAKATCCLCSCHFTEGGE